MSIKNKKIVLFSPHFFDYPQKICEEIETHGGKVFCFDERPFTSSLGKILIRLNVSIVIRYYINKYYADKLKKLKEIAPDYILFLSPESVRREDLIQFKKKLPESKIIIYMWDSFGNKPYSKQYIDVVDYFYSFDRTDAEKYKLQFLPLFYTHDYEQLRGIVPLEYDYCFIGTVHSNRAKAVRKLISDSTNQNFTFFYCPSRLVFILKKLFTHEFDGLKLKDISFKPLDRKLVMDVIAKSKCVIDIAHPKQQGLTMRTIESLGAGKKIATNNKNIKSYDFYNENMHFIISSNTSTIPESFINALGGDDRDISSEYRLDRWLETVLQATLN